MEDPRRPERNCYQDVAWSQNRGQFFSFEACGKAEDRSALRKEAEQTRKMLEKLTRCNKHSKKCTVVA